MIDSVYIDLLKNSFAGTIVLVPSLSDFMFTVMAAWGSYNPALLWSMAMLGAMGASCVNYATGYFLTVLASRRSEPKYLAKYESARALFSRFGVWVLLFTPWFVMEFFTVLAGIFRAKIPTAFVLVLLGKAAWHAHVIYTLAGK